MRLFVSAITLFLISNLGFAQKSATLFPSQVWHKGEVTLKDGTMEQGHIQYDLEKETVRLSKDGEILIYKADRLEKFSFFQKGIDRQRNFYALPYGVSEGNHELRLFELVLEGETNLLAREFIKYTSQTRVNEEAKHGLGRLHRVKVAALNYDYYLVADGGEPKAVKTRRKKVAMSFGSNQEKVLSFIKANGLNTKELVDMTKLVSYYNSLN